MSNMATGTKYRHLGFRFDEFLFEILCNIAEYNRTSEYEWPENALKKSMFFIIAIAFVNHECIKFI
jgi:hypothetical protein